MNQVNPEIVAALRPLAIEAADLPSLPDYKRAVEQTILGAGTAEGQRQREAWRIDENLGPIAFDGNPATAKVLLLKANPSYGDGATRETHFQPHPDWPLSVAGPDVIPETRTYYQNRVFGSLRRAGGVTLEQISRRMLKVELCPWASKKWPTGQHKLLRHMANFRSRAPICELVRQLADQGVIVLIARAEEEWFAGVPRLRDLVGKRVFVSRAKIAPGISERMYPGSWQLVLEALRA